MGNVVQTEKLRNRIVIRTFRLLQVVHIPRRRNTRTVPSIFILLQAVQQHLTAKRGPRAVTLVTAPHTSDITTSSTNIRMFVTRNYELMNSYLKGHKTRCFFNMSPHCTLYTFLVHCTLAVGKNTLPEKLVRRVNNAHLAPTTEK